MPKEAIVDVQTGAVQVADYTPDPARVARSDARIAQRQAAETLKGNALAKLPQGAGLPELSAKLDAVIDYLGLKG